MIDTWYSNIRHRQLLLGLDLVEKKDYEIVYNTDNENKTLTYVKFNNKSAQEVDLIMTFLIQQLKGFQRRHTDWSKFKNSDKRTVLD